MHPSACELQSLGLAIFCGYEAFMGVGRAATRRVRLFHPRGAAHRERVRGSKMKDLFIYCRLDRLASGFLIVLSDFV